MAPRAKPACMSLPAEDAQILRGILLSDDEDKKIDARKEISKITVLWQHWSPRLKSVVRSDVEKLVPAGGDAAAALIAGYSQRIAAAALSDLGRTVI